MKKLLAIILVLAMLATSLVACTVAPSEGGSQSSESKGGSNAETPKPGESQGADESGNTGDTSETNPPAETSEEDAIGIPEGLNYGGDEVYIMHWTAYNPEFVVDDQADMGDPIISAIEKKNLYTEDTLGVTLDFTEVLGDGGQPDAFLEALKNRMSDPTTPVDIMAAYARTTAMISLEGLLQDITVCDNIDFSKPWWPKDIQDEYNINGKLYFISGDISTNLLLMMYGVYYNKTLLANYGRTNPVELVKTDDWTIDAFIEMTADIYEDLGNNQAMYGLVSSYWDFDAVYHASGYGLLDRTTEDGAYVKYSDELFSSIAEAYITKLSKWVATPDVIAETDYSGKAGLAFQEERALFTISSASIGFRLRENDMDYGAVPMPKLDPATQESYVTCLANPFSLYAIPVASLNPDRAAATLQTLGYYAYLHTTPAVYDVTLKGKFSKDEDTMAMWDLMRAGISFDLGRVFHTKLGGLCDVVSMAIATGKQWSIECSAAIMKGRLNKMRALNKILAELDN